VRNLYCVQYERTMRLDFRIVISD